MSDEKVTVVKDGGSGAGWFIGVVLVIAVIAGVFMFMQYNGHSAAKDGAITSAANAVGDTAKKAGDAIPAKSE